MPISVILLGVFIIALNFKMGQKVSSQLGLSLLMLDLVSIMAFLLLVVRPINILDMFYVSLGGFFVFTSLAIYLIFTVKQKKQYYKIIVSFLSLIGSSFLFDLIFPFMAEQIFDYKMVIVGIVSGLTVYLSTKTLKSAFIVIFLTMPTVNFINYIISIQNNPDIMLFLGVGNSFEISVIAFAFVYLIVAAKTYHLFDKNKESDVLTLTEDEVIELKKGDN